MENMEFDRLREDFSVLERKSGFAYDSSPRFRGPARSAESR